MDHQEHIINNRKVHVIDNAMPQHVIDRWIDFYENHASFRMISAEDGMRKKTGYWLSMPIDLKMRYQIFDIESWLLPAISNYNPQCTEKDFMRSYMNMSSLGDSMEGHVDTHDALDQEGEFFIASLVFMNPYVKDPADSGFEFEGGLYIENVFNRLIVFDGKLWHKAHIPTDNLVRLTMYNSFRNPRILADYSKSQAVWFK